MSMSFAQGLSLEGAGSSVLADAIGGLATVVLAIVALAGVASTAIVDIATIVFGAALLIHGGAMLSEYSRSLYPTGASAAAAESGGSSLSALFLAGATGIVLGILALLGLYSGQLAAISLIVFGCGWLLSSGSTSSLHALKSGSAGFETRRSGNEILAAEVASGSASVQALAGVAAIVLGILAVTGLYTGILTMVGLLVLGASILLTGSALTSTALGFMHSGRPETSAVRTSTQS